MWTGKRSGGRFGLRSLAIAFGVLCLALPAAGQDIETKRVKFDRGANGTTIKGSIKGYAGVDYVLGATAGQTMTVTMSTSNNANYFNVIAPGANQAMHVGSIKGNDFTATIPSSGDYTVRVYLMRSAARREETANFTLDFRITGGDSAAETTPKGDYADGLAGGPDYWKVDVETSLNVHSAPSTSAPTVARLPRGTVVRNLGCREAEARTWCQIGDGDATGWAAAEFLIEAAAPDGGGSKTAGADATVGDTKFNATGRIPCAIAYDSPMGSCDFGVVRKGGGTAVVTVFLPGGAERILHFQSGEPLMVEGSRSMTWDKRGDLILMEVDKSQRFEIPSAVIYGG